MSATKSKLEHNGLSIFSNAGLEVTKCFSLFMFRNVFIFLWILKDNFAGYIFCGSSYFQGLKYVIHDFLALWGFAKRSDDVPIGLHF